MERLLTEFTSFNVRMKKRVLTINSRQYENVFRAHTFCIMFTFGIEEKQFLFGYIRDIHKKIKKGF